MENLEIYNKVREVPENAQKTITAGRLKGMTDINPQWRIEKLTEVFGPVGIGWYAEETKREFVKGANDEEMCFVDINLYVKVDGEWSKAIYGTGGSTFVAKENKGLYTSDEVVKMAYTDAISVACKQLGFGADIYWNKTDSKYNSYNKNSNQTTKPVQQVKPVQDKKDTLITPKQKTLIQTLLSKFEDREVAKKELYDKFNITTITTATIGQAKEMIDYLQEKVNL